MQKFILITIIFFYSVLQLIAQNNIPELEGKLKTASGKEKIELLYKLSKLYLKSDTKKSLNYAEKSYNLAKKSKDKNMQANALNMMGTAYYQQQKYRLAIRNYEKELDLRKQLGQKYSKIKVEYNLAATYQISGKEKKALGLYKEVLDYSKKKNYPELTKKTYRSIIQVYVKEKDYKDAFLYLQEYQNYLNNIKTNYKQQKINL